MKAQIIEQVEFFSEAELESLEFVPEELEAIEAERVPDLESISYEEVAKDLEAYFEGDIEGAGLEGKKSKKGSSSGIKGGHTTTKNGTQNKDDHQKGDAARNKQQYNAYVKNTKNKNGKSTKKVLTIKDWQKQDRPGAS